MRWKTGRRSQNVEDRRGKSRAGMGLPFPTGRSGKGGCSLPMIILMVVLALVFDINPLQLLGGLNGGGSNAGLPFPTQQPQSQQTSGMSDEAGQFVSSVLASTEDVWAELFPQQINSRYQPTTLVLFSGRDRSGCGIAQSATGPFYCPADYKVYLDTSFFDELHRRFGAPGDFAQAYVIAHEVGHHIQTILGISEQVQRSKNRSNANELSVRQELHADCLAGVWAHHAHKKYNILEQGDINEAMNAASAIGDDRLQKQSQGYAMPDSFTHGTSAQRQRWLQFGLKTGDMNQCNNTFKVEYSRL